MKDANTYSRYEPCKVIKTKIKAMRDLNKHRVKNWHSINESQFAIIKNIVRCNAYMLPHKRNEIKAARLKTKITTRRERVELHA